MANGGNWNYWDTSNGSFEAYMHNAVNEYAGGIGMSTAASNASIWDDLGDASRENVMNMALAKYQLDMQRKENDAAWQRETEYNSPKNQMQRYMEAGLNPNVIVGQIANGNASFEAPKVNVPQMRSDRYQKLNKAMDIMNSLAQIIGQGAQLAGQIEGVKNQSLQNQLLEESMPSVIAQQDWTRDLYTAKSAEYQRIAERLKSGDSTAWLDYRNLLMPEMVRSAGMQSKTNYQDWWNNEIAPIYKNQLKGKSLSAEEQAKMDAYNREQLESFPPIVRPFVWLLTQMFGMVR